MNDSKPFKLGVIVVEVTTTDGQIRIEDWSREDADEAREYAGEVSSYSDVDEVVFRNALTGEKLLLSKGKIVTPA